MVDEQMVRRVALGRYDRVDNCLMLFRCETQGIRSLELKSAIGSDPVVERAGQIPKIVIVRAGIDRSMK